MTVFIYLNKKILKIVDTRYLDDLIFSQIIMTHAMEKEYACQHPDVHLPFVGMVLSAFLEITIIQVMVCVVIQSLTTQVSLIILTEFRNYRLINPIKLYAQDSFNELLLF